MKRKRPIAVRDTGRLDERHDAAKQIVRGHKSVDSVAQRSRFQKNCNDAKIHRYAAKLEGEYPPYVRIIAHEEIIEKLFINFRQNEKTADTSQNGFVSPFRKPAEHPCEKNANGYTDKGKRKMKGSVSGRRGHLPCGAFKKLI